MKSICVFCGSAPGRDPVYATAAHALGQLLAAQGITLITGGGSVGLMGAVADGTLSGGGQAVGIIPDFLSSREVGHKTLTELIVVPSMHARKQLMYERSDAFIALPGGMGTLDETCEILTWAQLGLHSKPFGMLNINGYYDAFIRFLDQAVEAGFLNAAVREMILVHDDAATLLDWMREYVGPGFRKWMGSSQT